MKRRQRGSLICGWICWLVLWVGIVEAQATNDNRLQIRLRASDGTPVVGETVPLQRLLEEEPVPPNCTTNANGECTWYVERGLYEVLFDRPLDDISALAVAEGGLRGLGVTVGDENITYHFTFHSDGYVYFDAAPEAAVPLPIIPTPDTLQGGVAATPLRPVITDEPIEETSTPEPIDVPGTAVDNSSGKSWRVILFIGGGLVIGGSLHFWSRKRKQQTRQPQNTKKEGRDA